MIRIPTGALAALVALCCAAAKPVRLPAKTSQLDGWRGVKIVRGRACPDCCTLVFPRRFGAANREDIEALRLLFRPDIEDDLSCTYHTEIDVLSQLRRLATEQHDRGAALVILAADTPGGLDLGGGEVSETYAEDYLVPTLRSFPHVDALLTPELRTHIADAVCGAAEMSGVDVRSLLKALLAKRDGALAERIRAACGG